MEASKAAGRERNSAKARHESSHESHEAQEQQGGEPQGATGELREAVAHAEQVIRQTGGPAGSVLHEVEKAGQEMLAKLRPPILTVDAAQEMGGLIIDTGKEIGAELLRFQERLAILAKGTPLAPLLGIQASIGRGMLDDSVKLARDLWQTWLATDVNLRLLKASQHPAGRA